MADTLSNAPGTPRSAAAYSAPALEKGFDIIELLADAPGGLTISEMASRLGRSVSEIFRIVRVMEMREWLSRDPHSDRLRVTYKLLELAHRATPAEELAHVAAPIMANLVQRTVQACHLVVLEGSHGLVVMRKEAPGAMGFALRVGARIDLPTTGSGHVLLAYATPDERAALIGQSAADALAARLETVRDRGYELQPSARAAVVRDASCPVFGFDGKIIAAMTIPFVEWITGDQTVGIEAALDELKEAARDVSRGLGWYDRDEKPVRPSLSVAARPATRGRRKASSTAN